MTTRINRDLGGWHARRLRNLGLDVVSIADLRVLAAVMDADSPPTHRDLCRAVGAAQAQVNTSLVRLTAAGLVTRAATQHRTTRVCCAFLTPDELEAAAWMIGEGADDGR